jgi:hypothetical protein
MKPEDEYTYYSRHFNIICEKEPQVLLPIDTYRLVAMLNPGPLKDDGPVTLEVITNITEERLDLIFEELKEKIYLTLEL